MSKHVVVIGAGLGGISAAIMLARSGYKVTICEKNSQIGGKLSLLETQGFRFDLGPSIFSLPQIFRPLFEQDGKSMEDYVSLKRVDPQWRNFFEDGTVLDLWEQPDRMQAELARFGPKVFKEYSRFLSYSQHQYSILERGYLREGLESFWQFMRFYGLKGARNLDYRRSMSASIYKRVSSPHLRDIFEYFIKYVGSSALNSPAFMNLMPNIQMEFGLWYVSGGLYQLARALERRLEETGITLCLQSEVLRIDTDAKSVRGVEVARVDGSVQVLKADYVVSNMEVLPAMKQLLASKPSSRSEHRFEPSCSGIVMHVGLNRIYPQLAHHNFFYSADQHAYFNQVFREKKLPSDPTIYVVAPTRSDPSQAPEGCDNLKILAHVPYINRLHPYSDHDYATFRDLCLSKLERMGLRDLRQHILIEDFWTPRSIEARYGSNCGSIYGVVCDRRKNFAFKARRRSSQYSNLYFVGGSVNPGAGMPMVVLSGMHVARSIAEQDGRMS